MYDETEIDLADSKDNITAIINQAENGDYRIKLADDYNDDWEKFIWIMAQIWEKHKDNPWLATRWLKETHQRGDNNEVTFHRYFMVYMSITEVEGYAENLVYDPRGYDWEGKPADYPKCIDAFMVDSMDQEAFDTALAEYGWGNLPVRLLAL